MRSGDTANSPSGVHGREITLRQGVELHQGVFVTKGTTVLIAVPRPEKSKYWEDPTAFKPERWLVQSPYSDGTLARDALKNLGPNDAYFPFGGGPRVCIGTGFAMMESVLFTRSHFAASASFEFLRTPVRRNQRHDRGFASNRASSRVAPRPRKI